MEQEIGRKKGRRKEGGRKKTHARFAFKERLRCLFLGSRTNCLLFFCFVTQLPKLLVSGRGGGRAVSGAGERGLGKASDEDQSFPGRLTTELEGEQEKRAEKEGTGREGRPAKQAGDWGAHSEMEEGRAERAAALRSLWNS